jgi:DNA-binding response OmpR family regulator
MARILISESHMGVRRLLVRMIGELGHESLLAEAPSTAEDLDGISLLVVEPADPKGALLTKTVQALDPGLPILCVSVLDASLVGIEYGVFLSKPFTFAQLADAVEQALAQSASGRATV